MADDKIGSVNEERQKLQQLETPLRVAAVKEPGSAAALQARQTLQAEVDKINNSRALRDPGVRSDFIGRVAGYLAADDIAAVETPDKRVHLSTVAEDKPGHLTILPDATIRADEDRVKANLKLGLRPYLDPSQATHFLHTHGRPEAAIQNYDKAVFGLPAKESAKSVQQYESEFNSLRRAAYDLFAARAGLDGSNLARATSQMSTLLGKLNAEGSDHVNHLTRGMTHIVTDCFENTNGKIALKSEAGLARWQKQLQSSGVSNYDLNELPKIKIY